MDLFTHLSDGTMSRSAHNLTSPSLPPYGMHPTLLRLPPLRSNKGTPLHVTALTTPNPTLLKLSPLSAATRTRRCMSRRLKEASQRWVRWQQAVHGGGRDGRREGIHVAASGSGGYGAGRREAEQQWNCPVTPSPREPSCFNMPAQCTPSLADAAATMPDFTLLAPCNRLSCSSRRVPMCCTPTAGGTSPLTMRAGSRRRRWLSCLSPWWSRCVNMCGCAGTCSRVRAEVGGYEGGYWVSRW